MVVHGWLHSFRNHFIFQNESEKVGLQVKSDCKFVNVEFGRRHFDVRQSNAKDDGRVSLTQGKYGGNHFKNLEMITTLLQTSKKRDNLPQIPKIEMISSQNGEVNDDEKEMIDQLSDLKLNQFTYGFQGKFSGIFSDLKVR